MLKTVEFDYWLPPELIAQTPIEPRDAARLLVVRRSDGSLSHRHFRDLGEYLNPGDLLVLNESRVIPARLHARKVPTGGRVEILLLTRHDPQTWEALVSGRRARPGTRLHIEAPPAALDAAPPEAEVIAETPGGGRLIRFAAPVDELLEALGEVPLPPYIHVPLADRERYQTIYARTRGSVAAPTAGLHFTPALLESLRQRGIRFAMVTLHIGLDTFRPVQEERVEEHVMHREWCRLDEDAAALIVQARASGKRIVAVGTTTARVLETAARYAEESAAAEPALPFAGWTDLFIYPGYRFRLVDALVTNFHLPRSTLIMLVAAFAGRDLIMHAYQEAIRQRYRFYSLGDAMLILRRESQAEDTPGQCCSRRLLPLAESL